MDWGFGWADEFCGENAIFVILGDLVLQLLRC